MKHRVILRSRKRGQLLKESGKKTSQMGWEGVVVMMVKSELIFGDFLGWLYEGEWKNDDFHGNK